MSRPFITFFGLVFLVAGCATAPVPREMILEKNWTRSTLKKDHLAYRRMNRMSPLLMEKTLIEGNGVDGIVAYERASGQEKWRLPIRNGVEGGAQIVNDRLYFGAGDGMFYCVQVDNGKVIWSIPVRAETLSAPFVDNGIVYVETGADVVFAFDALSGKQLWSYNRQITTSLSIRATTRPVVSGEVVYAGFSDGFLVALKKRDGGILWEKKLTRSNRFKDVDATPVIDGNTIYTASFDGALFALNRESGEIQWQFDEGAYAPVLLAGDRLYYATSSGNVHALDKLTGKPVWSKHVSHGIATPPQLYRGYLVYGESEGSLVVTEADTGKTVTEFSPGHGLASQPAIDSANDDIYFISSSANLYAMKVRWRKRTDLLPWQVK